jgi:hypothetical protein
MKKYLVFVFFYLFTWFCISCEYVFAETVPHARDILAIVMTSRQLIQSGEIEIDSSYNDASGYKSSKHWKVYFDGSKKRSDVQFGNNIDNSTNGHTDVICVNCYSKNTIFYYTTQPPPNSNGKMALCFYDGSGKSNISFYIPEPKWFGYTSFTLESSIYQNPHELYGSNINLYKFVPDVYSDNSLGIDSWRIDFKYTEVSLATLYSLWIDKSDASRVICAESRFNLDEEGNKILFIDRVESETEKFKNKIWFPTKLKYRRTENGKVTMSSDTAIKVISLNEPLPPNIFSPKGVDFLKPGTPVMWALGRDKPAEGNLEWDGEKIVPIETKGKVVAEPSGSNIKVRIFFVLFGIAMIFIGVGIKFLRDSFKRDKNG